MAPEMAAAYVVGWVPSLAVTGLHLYLQKKRVASNSYHFVQKNLCKAGLIWSDSESRITPWSETGEAQDLESARRSILMMGAFSFFLSWAGMFFHLIIIFSLHVFAVSRLEKSVFGSSLAQQDLSLELVQAELQDLTDRGYSIPTAVS